jgi:predicted acyl esterase
MSLGSRVIQRMQHLPPPLTRDLVVERDLRVPMRDGAVLLAERGFQVLIQSTRGTFGSGGDFDPLRCEREDGLDTLEWLVTQPWCGESVVLRGGSYLGFVQWAVADQLPPQVKAMIPAVSESAFTLEFLRTESFSLEATLGWGVQVAEQERRFALPRQRLRMRRERRAPSTLPLNQADIAATGPCGRPDGKRASPPARGRTSPWAWGRRQSARPSTSGWPHAHGREPSDRAPVRLYVMGEEAWRDFPSWPPPGYPVRRLHLQPGGALAVEPPAESDPDGYRDDPADPTPAVGGARLLVGAKSGRADNTRLEARPDVLTYTTAELDHDAEVVGEVSAEIWIRSSLPYADVFVRLCDVDEKGRSTNVCDGLISLTGADQVSCAAVRLWPTAYLFKRGHRIRVQVSSGAFPRYNRNPGTGEPRATATVLRAADQQIFHDPTHPSAVILPWA